MAERDTALMVRQAHHRCEANENKSRMQSGGMDIDVALKCAARNEELEAGWHPAQKKNN